MRVLLIGSGGREHAIGWKLAQDDDVSLTSLPGNPGLESLGATIEGISQVDAGAVAAMASAQGFDLVVVGPEAPLAAGVVDALERASVPVFGPSRAAARLESSKAFAKQMMDRAGVPTARWGVYEDPDAAKAHLADGPGPHVVKADGLAAGKGVLVTDDRSDAEAWVDACFDGRFGDAGRQVVIEDFLAGPEISVFAVCDGSDALPLVPARDYKRLTNGDRGPNTGGMGSFSPVADLPADLVDFTMQEVVKPMLATMSDSGMPYRGFLYTGFVLTKDGPQVLEFNCRLGDPETQVVLPRLESSLVDLLLAGVEGTVAGESVGWADNAAVNVVMAAEGYPTAPRSGDVIVGDLEPRSDSLVFQAGTAVSNERIVTAGGRVVNVVGLGTTVEAARQVAYERVATISWPGVQFRTDIAGEK